MPRSVLQFNSSRHVAVKNSNQSFIFDTFSTINGTTLTLPEAGLYWVECCFLYSLSLIARGIGINCTVTNPTIISLSVDIYGIAAPGAAAAFHDVITASGGNVTSTTILAINTFYPAYVRGLIRVSADNSTVTFGASVNSIIAAPTATIRADSVATTFRKISL